MSFYVRRFAILFCRRRRRHFIGDLALERDPVVLRRNKNNPVGPVPRVRVKRCGKIRLFS